MTKDRYISIKNDSEGKDQLNDGDDTFYEHETRRANKVSDWIVKMCCIGSNGSNPLRRSQRTMKPSCRNSSHSSPSKPTMVGSTVVICEDVIPIVYLGGKPKSEII